MQIRDYGISVQTTTSVGLVGFFSKNCTTILMFISQNANLPTLFQFKHPPPLPKPMAPEPCDGQHPVAPPKREVRRIVVGGARALVPGKAVRQMGDEISIDEILQFAKPYQENIKLYSSACMVACQFGINMHANLFDAISDCCKIFFAEHVPRYWDTVMLSCQLGSVLISPEDMVDKRRPRFFYASQNTQAFGNHTLHRRRYRSICRKIKNGGFGVNMERLASNVSGSNTSFAFFASVLFKCVLWNQQ